MAKNLFKLADTVIAEGYKLHNKYLEFKRKVDANFIERERLSKQIAETGVYRCIYCGKWHKPIKMQTFDKNEALGSNNKCISCHEERYFNNLAKSSIVSSGLKISQCPDEFIEMVKIHTKTDIS